jgi:hypothetical protein
VLNSISYNPSPLMHDKSVPLFWNSDGVVLILFSSHQSNALSKLFFDIYSPSILSNRCENLTIFLPGPQPNSNAILPSV